MGKPGASLKVIQLIASIREDLEAYRAKTLVKGMVESDTSRNDNAEEAEVGL